MTDIGLLLVTPIEVAAIALSLGFTVVSFRTYRATRARSYRHAFSGFASITLGMIFESVLFRTGWVDAVAVHGIETLLFAVGFGFLYLSIR